MATHDYVIANQSGAAFRTDLNNALAAIVSNNSNSSEPATKYAYQWWADTSAGVLKIRNSANNGWIELLQLDGTITLEDGSASSPALGFRDDLDTGVFSGGANEFNISTGGLERFVLDSSGKCGIGEITPAAGLDVKVDTNPVLAIDRGSANNANFNIHYNGTLTGQISAANGDFQLSAVGTNTPISFFTNGSQRMTIDSSGNVEIPSDSTELQLGASQDFRLFHNGSANKIIAQNAELLVQCEAYSIRSENGGTIYATILSSGNVGIGLASPASLLHVSSSTNSYFRFQDLASETIGVLIRKNTTSTYTAIDLRNANGPSGTLTVSNNSVSLSNASDYRLKENETVISDGTTKIKQLIPRRFNFKVEPDRTVDGFFAHEVSGVVPEAVIGEKDATIDEDGNGYQSLDATKLIPILTAGLKEAISKIETLETKVAALEAA